MPYRLLRGPHKRSQNWQINEHPTPSPLAGEYYIGILEITISISPQLLQISTCLMSRRGRDQRVNVTENTLEMRWKWKAQIYPRWLRGESRSQFPLTLHIHEDVKDVIDSKDAKLP